MFTSPFKKPKSSIPQVAPVELYDNCRVLPIHNFNECMNGDLSYLQRNRTDKVDVQTLANAWLLVMDEYLKLSKNAIANNQIEGRNKLIHLYAKLKVFESAAYCIGVGVDVTDALKPYQTSPEKLKTSLAIVRNEIAKAEKRMPNDDNDQKDPYSFDASIAYILENGYHINRFTTVVSEYCQILNRLDAKQKALKNQ